MKYEKKSQMRERSAKQDNKRVTGKRSVIISVIIIILVFISAQLLYSYVIPRVTIDIKTIYHEATGGGGTGGLINVNTKIINSGTIEISSLKVTLLVFDSSMKLLSSETYEVDYLSAGSDHELKLITNGNCFEPFFIGLELEFGTPEQEYQETYNYKTHEDAMNIGFEDSIFDWAF